jgi:hypothetical protein
LVCAAIVVTLFYSLAWYFGPEIITWIRTAEEGITIAVITALVVGAVLFWVHHRRSKRMLETLDRISQGLPATEIAAVIEAATPHESDSADNGQLPGEISSDGKNSAEQTRAAAQSSERDS